MMPPRIEAAKMPHFGLTIGFGRVEGQRGDKHRHGESYGSEEAQSGKPSPCELLAASAQPQPFHQPYRGENAKGFAGKQAQHHAHGDVVVEELRQIHVDKRHARIAQRKDGHDEERHEGMKAVLKAAARAAGPGWHRSSRGR